MGMFKGVNEAKVYDKGVYMEPGHNWVLKFEKAIAKETRASGNAFIVEFSVIESTCSAAPPGAKRTWFQSMKDKDVAFGAIKEFMRALCNVNPDSKHEVEEFDNGLEEILELATEFEGDADQHPLVGCKIRCETRTVKTKKGEDFTLHAWSRFGDD